MTQNSHATKSTHQCARVLHRVLWRGIDLRNIFRYDVDRKGFVDVLENALVETETRCSACAGYELELATTEVAKILEMSGSQPDCRQRRKDCCEECMVR